MKIIDYDIAEINQLGYEMRQAAYSHMFNEFPKHSDKENKQLIENVKNPMWFLDKGLARVISFKDGFFSVCLTADDFDSIPFYRLSMCYITQNDPLVVVPEPFATEIAHCILGPLAKFHIDSNEITHKYFIREINV